MASLLPQALEQSPMGAAVADHSVCHWKEFAGGNGRACTSVHRVRHLTLVPRAKPLSL